jgi:hypothetical protein
VNQETVKLIEQLAAKLGTTADHLWAVLVRQAGIEVWVSVVTIVILGAFSALWISTFSKWDDWIDDGMGAVVMAGTIVSVVFLFIVGCEITELPTLLLNPEYWALKEVLDVLGR